MEIVRLDINRSKKETMELLKTHSGYELGKGKYRGKLVKGSRFGLWHIEPVDLVDQTCLKLGHENTVELKGEEQYPDQIRFLESEIRGIQLAFQRKRGLKSVKVVPSSPVQKEEVINPHTTLVSLSFHLDERKKNHNEQYVEDVIRLIPSEVISALQKIKDPKLIECCKKINASKDLKDVDAEVERIVAHLKTELDKPGIKITLKKAS